MYIKNISIILLLSLQLISLVVAADTLKAYTLGGKFQATFSSQPKFLGSMNYEGNTYNSYASTDEIRKVMFSSIFPIKGQTTYSKQKQEQEIKNFVTGFAKSSNAKLLHLKTYKGNGAQCADYTFSKITQGITIKTFGKVIYADSRFYQWGIKEFVGVTLIDAQSLFNETKSNFYVH